MDAPYFEGTLRRPTHRFNQLLLNLDGISTKTLSTRLEELVQAQLVQRASFPEIPPQVEYAITEKGKDLSSIMCRLETFSKRSEATPAIPRTRAGTRR